jgi:glycosyltransferase involved in cell wall biosynthesis
MIIVQDGLVRNIEPIISLFDAKNNQAQVRRRDLGSTLLQDLKQEYAIRGNDNMNPLVTIIIPTYNRAEFLPQAIDGALSQTYADFELLILDDASTDNTPDVVLPYLVDQRIRYFKNSKNLGISRNRNYGLSLAKGEYVAMLDSDDVWLGVRKLQIQVDILELETKCGLVGTDATIIDKNGLKIGSITNFGSDAAIRMTVFIKNQFVQSSVLIRKQALADVGDYNEAIPIWEDYELWLRIGEKYKLRNVQELLTGYRDHDTNVSKTSGQSSLEAYRQIYERHGRNYPMRGVLLLKIWIRNLSLHFKRHVHEDS